MLALLPVFGLMLLGGCQTDAPPLQDLGTPVESLADIGTAVYVGGDGSGDAASKIIFKITDTSSGAGSFTLGGTEKTCTWSVPSRGSLTATYDSGDPETFEAYINADGALVLVINGKTYNAPPKANSGRP